MAGEALFQNQRAPWLTVDETASASVTTPPDTGDTRLFIDSADGLLKQKDDAGTVTTVGAAGITTHEADTTSAHTAEGIDIVDAGALITATQVEAALQEIVGNLNTHTADIDAHLHASAHADGGTDELTVETLATAASDTSYALKPDGVGGVAFGTVSTVGVIDDLTDVDTDKSKTPADGDVLTYDGTHWNAEAATGGSADSGTIATAFSWVLDSPAASDNWEFRVPFDCTIVGNEVYADASGSIVIDIWNDTYANYPPTDADSITASAPPTLSTATKSTDTTLTGWTTSLSAGDILKFNVDSISTVTRVTLVLLVEAVLDTLGDTTVAEAASDVDYSVTQPSTAAWTALSTTDDIVLDAQEGDQILFYMGSFGSNENSHARQSMYTMVSGTPTNLMTGANGIPGASHGYGVYGGHSGAWVYDVQAGDVSSGQITLRPYAYAVHATTKTLSSAGHWAINLTAIGRATASQIQNGVVTGTGFPGSPTTGQRYRRSDLDYMVFFYDGTRWLTEQLFEADLSTYGFSHTASASGHHVPLNTSLSTWLVDWKIQFYSNNASADWDVTLRQCLANNSSYVTIKSQNLTIGGADQWSSQTVTVDTEVDGTQGNSGAVPVAIQTDWVKTTGNIEIMGSVVTYRLIAT